MPRTLYKPVLVRIGSVRALTRALDVGPIQEPFDPTHYFYP